MNAATNYMTQDEHFNIIHITGSWKNKKPHAVGCKFILINVIGNKLTV